MILIPNDMIACEPIADMSIQTSGKSFVIVKQKNALLALKVVYGSLEKHKHPYEPGTTVYIRGDNLTLPWAGTKFTLGTKEVILVPCNAIQACETPGHG